MRRAANEVRAVRVFFALAFVVFTCVFPYIASINNPNENVRVYMTMALVEGHTFRIDDIVARHGWVNDMARAPDKTGEPHLYSVKAPAASYAGVPVYWAFTRIAPRFGHPVPTLRSAPAEKAWWLKNTIFVLRLFVIQLPCFVFLVWFERFLRLVSGDVVLRLSAVAAAGMGTNYLAYALMFASHSPFACAAFASFGIITRERCLHPDPARRRLSMAFLAGLLAGLATLLEYHALPVSVGLAAYALTTFGRLAPLSTFGAGAAIDALLLMFFQWRAFGNPLTPGHKFSETESFREILSTGLFGISAPKLEAIQGITVNTGFGFFGTSPYMWLGLLAIPLVVLGPRVRRRADDLAATVGWLGLMLVLFLTVSAAINWRAGWALGPRYLGAAPPFFAYGATCALERLAVGGVKRVLARGVAGGLALASVVQSGLVSLVYNTLPESVTRPLAQFALPMIRVGFVPHHAGELFGWSTPTFWYLVAGCLGALALLAALLPAGDGWMRWLARVVLCAGVCALGLRPAFSAPKRAELVCTNGNHCDDDVTGAIHFFPGAWEPAKRDRLSLAREALAKPGDHGCAWLEIARLEKILGWDKEATADAAHAQGATAAMCKTASRGAVGR